MPRDPYKLNCPLFEAKCNSYNSIAVDGKKVDFMFREESQYDSDSGWTFCSSCESQPGVELPPTKIFSISDIARSNPDIVPLLNSPFGDAFERDASGKFVPYKDKDEIDYELARDKAITVIMQAFKGVPLDDGISLHQADALDGYADSKAARLLDTEKSWTEVSLTEHRYNSAILCFLDPKGFRFYIPAYMIWILKNRHLSSNIASATVWHLTLPEETASFSKITFDQYKLLSATQSSAVKVFLECMAKFRNDDAKVALDRYWKMFG